MEDTYLIRTLMKIGSKSELDPEEKRRRISAVFILLISVIAVLAFSIDRVIADNYFIAVLDWISIFSILAVFFILRSRERASSVYWLISIIYVIIISISTVVNRSEISYMFWIYLIPPITFTILGHKKGIILNLLAFPVFIYLMIMDWAFIPAEPYSVSAIIRFAAIYLMFMLIIYVCESSRQVFINHIRNEKDKFEIASRLDSLTGLSNRMDIMAKIQEEHVRQQRLGNSFTLILGDIDDFKNINDNYGHESGDYVLKEIAAIIKNQVRGIDYPSRLGGEEFLIMLVETNIYDAKRVAERIRSEIESTVFSYGHTSFSLTMTFGLCTCMGTDSIEACINRADQAMYIGKNYGKNRVVVT